jgi:hypothetical protein
MRRRQQPTSGKKTIKIPEIKNLRITRIVKVSLAVYMSNKKRQYDL